MSFLKGLRGALRAQMSRQRGSRSCFAYPFTGPLLMEPLVRNRKSNRLARFIPAVERLEVRLTPSGAPLVTPQILQSVNGVLNATLTLAVGPVQIGDTIVQDAWTYNGMYPGPTLAVNPGDELNINLINNLPMETNLHTHGFHVSPIGNSDNVLIMIEPGESNQFHIEIPDDHPQGLYWYHPHRHGNASVQLFRGASGMIAIGRPDGGFPELNGLTQQLMAVNAAQVVVHSPQPGIVPGQFFMKDPPTLDPVVQTFTTNGQINPVLTMRPNEYQVVNMVNNSSNAFYTPGFVDVTPGFTVANTTTAGSSDGVTARTATTINVASTSGFTSSGLIRVTTNGTNPTLYHYTGITPSSFTGLVSQGKSPGNLISGGSVTQVINYMWPVATDGNPFTSVGNVGDLSEPELISFRPGGRTSFIIGGFEAGHTYAFTNGGYRNPSPGVPEVGDGTHVWPPFPMFTVNVAGPPVPGGTPSFIPVFDPVTNAPSKPPLSPPNNYFRDLRDPSVVVAVRRTVVFGQGITPEGMNVDTINGEPFPNSVVFQPRLNTVEEWTLVNPTDDDHPFHLHTNAAQVIGPGQGPAFEVVGPGQAGQRRGLPIWMDVINVPKFTTQIIRVLFTDFLGTNVYHCHRVDHEDMGMMALTHMIPEEPIYAIGANAGQAPEVRVFNPVTGEQVSRFLAFDAPPTPPSPAGDSVGVVDPQNATWYLRNSNTPGAPDFAPFTFGVPGWKPIVGDWDGNGSFTPGIFDPSTATWYLRNSSTPGAPDVTPFTFGVPGWTPVVGDWDGNGTFTIGVVDPLGTWYLRNSNSQGAPDVGPFRYGAPGWKPVVGDWDGNGTYTVGVFAPNATWFLRNSNSPGAPDVAPFVYGAPDWTPVVGDWNNDGVTTVGVFAPNATWFLRNSNSPGAPDITPFAFGAGTWTPLAGDWDGAVVSSVNVAVADVNGDGVYDVITGRGTGEAHVKVIDGTRLNQVDPTTGRILPSALLGDFFVNNPGGAGVFVAGGDMNGDSRADVITGAGAGSRVQVIDATKLDDVDPTGKIRASALLADFLAFEPTFNGGARVAAGDIDGNGRIDLITAPGPGREPRVKVIDSTKLDQVDPTGEIRASALLADFLAYDQAFAGGVYVGTGNIKGFAFPDLITGPGAGINPLVKIFSKEFGRSHEGGQAPLELHLTDSFMAYPESYHGGVIVTSLHEATALPPSGGSRDDVVTTRATGDGTTPDIFPRTIPLS